MKKKLIIPKAIYDKMDKKNPIDFDVLMDINQITDPYTGQLGYEQANDGSYTIYAYKHECWKRIKLPNWINPEGRFELGTHTTYYLYWINYKDPLAYDGAYMLSSIPIYINYYIVSGIIGDAYPINDDDIHEAICNITASIVSAGGEVRFFESAQAAGQRAAFLAEQYKYSMIETVVKQFENVHLEYIKEGEDDNEA